MLIPRDNDCCDTVSMNLQTFCPAQGEARSGFQTLFCEFDSDARRVNTLRVSIEGKQPAHQLLWDVGALQRKGARLPLRLRFGRPVEHRESRRGGGKDRDYLQDPAGALHAPQRLRTSLK